jgi:hypothetical protein
MRYSPTSESNASNEPQRDRRDNFATGLNRSTKLKWLHFCWVIGREWLKCKWLEVIFDYLHLHDPVPLVGCVQNAFYISHESWWQRRQVAGQRIQSIKPNLLDGTGDVAEQGCFLNGIDGSFDGTESPGTPASRDDLQGWPKCIILSEMIQVVGFILKYLFEPVSGSPARI